MLVSFGQNNPEKAYDQAQALYEAGKYKETIAFCDESINKLKIETTQDSLEYGFLNYYIGGSHYYLDNYEKSIEAYNNAIPYASNNQEGLEQKGNLLYERCFSEYALSKNLKAFRTMQQAIAVLENIKKPNFDILISAYNSNANNAAELGYTDYALYTNGKATRLYNQYKEKVDSLTDTSYELILKRGKAFILKNKIDVDYDEKDGKTLFNTLKDIDNYINKKRNILTSRERLYVADVYNRYGDHFLTRNYPNTTIQESDSAIFYLNSAIKILEKKKYRAHYRAFRFNLVKAYEAQKKYDKALNILNDLLQKVDATSYNYKAFLTFKVMLLLKKKEFDKAKTLTHQIIEAIHDSDETLNSDYSNFSPNEHLWSTGLLLNLKESVEDIPKQNKELSQLIATLSNLAFKQLKHCHRLSNFNKLLKDYYLRSIYGQLNYYNSNNGNTTFATQHLLNDTENIENRLAWQQFNQSREVVHLPIIDSLEQVEFQLRKQLVQAKKQRQEKQQDSLQDALSKHKRHIEHNYPKFANFTQDDFEITQFQKQIRDNEAILKYLFFKEDFVVFTITKDTIQWQLKPWGALEKKQLAHHLEVIKNPLADLSIDQNLTDILIPQEALAYQTLTIVPDAPIYALPFETLIWKNNYLVEEKSIRYSSHLRFAFFEEEKKNTPNAQVTIFAPEYPKNDVKATTRSVPYYLEGAQAEAKVLSKLFPSKTFIGKAASKEAFVKNKSGNNILHLAMHATVDDINPEFSAFNFPNNEKLHIEELYALNIPADLAVLSACNTAVGKVNAASSMASLQRAFTFAGAKATVASLWEVPDQTTSKIMISFYKHLKKGYPKSEALQAAKINYLQNTNDELLKHPYYWAGFVVYGDDVPISQSSISYWWYILGALLVLLLLLFYFKKNKKV